jgi:hypothetical protein
VSKKDIEHYNCEQKEEYTKKSKSLVKLAAAVEKANAYEKVNILERKETNVIYN